VPDRKLIRYLDDFEKTHVLVIGDLMVDHYIWGKVNRISPEAPVPVVDVIRDDLQLGGAANVAHNILTLGGIPLISGTVGADEKGRWLIREFEKRGVGTEGIVVDDSRPTTQKTRVIAHSQHVVRFDFERKEETAFSIQESILKNIRDNIRKVRTIIISDYAKGVITSALLKEVKELSRQSGIKIVVDPKVQHFEFYSGTTLITPNTLEASRASGVEIRDERDLLKAGELLLKKSRSEAILITRGEEGMSLFEKKGGVTHIPSVAREVFDVTGAGDTVVSTLSLSIAAGVPLKDSARLANFAAGVVVGHVGTATVTREQLAEAIANHGG
jgi:D-beta-D-heptose 7-phosphate kinase/D-beta-D-heptose 1-phosphate adenosyltransferase